jgi:hypothetical protein
MANTKRNNLHPANLIETIVSGASGPIDSACRLYERAMTALESDDVVVAESLLLEALDIFEREYGEDSPDVANILSVLAEVYCDRQHYADAEWCAERSLEIIERVTGRIKQPDPDIGLMRVQALEGLAEVYRIEGRTEKSEPLRRRARVLARRIPAMPKASASACLTVLAIAHCRW